MYSITGRVDIYPKIVQTEVFSSKLNMITKNPQNEDEKKN